jgi:ABC-type lipopolysaccharide export system ATPase subunit
VDVPEIDVRLDRVSKLFGDAAAVDDLSLDIQEGEFFSMLGPSGLRQDDHPADFIGALRGTHVRNRTWAAAT